MQTLTTLEDLDAKIVELDRAAAISDAELRKQFDTFRFVPSLPSGVDPDSQGYRDWQFSLYEKIAGKPYGTSNEKSDLDPIAAADRPFPYRNEGYQNTGDQLIAIGWILKVLALPPGASVLELGPGWGNTTIALARTGYAVTAIDIESNFVALIRERARRKNLAIDVRQGDFFDAETLGRTFDAVLFFECFHHCADHNRLLDLLDRLVGPGGVVAFAAEPITEEFHAPWGLRLDGESLWAIRKFGWLELGFTQSYFVRSLLRRGWRVEKRMLEGSPLAIVFTAKRAEGRLRIGEFLIPLDESRSWRAEEKDPGLDFRFTSDDSVLTLPQGADAQTIELEVSNAAKKPLPVTLTYGRHRTTTNAPPLTKSRLCVPYDREARTPLRIETPVWRTRDRVRRGVTHPLGVAVRSVTLS